MAHAGHAHTDGREEGGGRIAVAFSLNLAFALVELAGGLWTNSVAVLSDALHDFGDCAALAVSWRFARMARRRGDEVYTFGYRRFSLLGALTMGAALLVGGAIVLWRAVPRLLSPQSPDAKGMLLLAGIGILVNGVSALRMRGGRSLNERLVTWHLMEDVLGWVAVLIVGAAMLFWSVPVLDPILSILITLFVLWNVGKRVREALVILLEGVPDTLTVAEVEEAIRATPGVCDVHHTHVWSEDGLHHVLTTHAVVANADSYADVAALRRQLKEGLKRFGILHSTIEFESQGGPACGDPGERCRCGGRE